MKLEEIGYASVRGTLHFKDGSPNQDAYSVKRYQFGTVLVIADGLGSKPHADIGAKAAGKAVNRAIQIWNTYENKDIRLLLPLLVSLWSMEIFPYAQKECSTTCLFAFVAKDGTLYLGQLGDGAIYLSLDGEVQILQEKEDKFSNMTLCLGGFSGYADWSLRQIDYTGKELCIAMMTDGVAETLVNGQQEKFVTLLWKRISAFGNRLERNHFIYRLLSEWNPASAGDDRTLICYKRR